MPKFFIHKEDIADQTVTITGGDAAHIAKVLRMEPGAEITLCDGEGTDFVGKLISCTKDEVVCAIQSQHPCETEPALSFVLFQGLPKQGKMDYIIEKCTELGIAAIVPVACERSVAEIKNPQAEEKKLARWRKIAAESVKQCGRGVITKVAGVMTVKEALDFSKQLDIDELYAYIQEVKKSTEEIVKGLSYDMLKQKVSEDRKNILISQNVVSTDEEAYWLVDYWCGKDIRGLIQMPFSRHWIMHIEACLRIKNKI